jgi:hypothetical protein
MSRPSLHLATPDDAPATGPEAPALATLLARADAVRAERAELFVAKLAEVIGLAREIADPEAGYRPGIRDGARRLITRLEGEANTLRALNGRQP